MIPHIATTIHNSATGIQLENGNGIKQTIEGRLIEQYTCPTIWKSNENNREPWHRIAISKTD